MNEKVKKVKEITEQLAEGIKKLFEDEDYAEYLRFMASFHDYSWNNIMLIKLQCPKARLVAGYKAWQKKGRFVMKGQKGISILAPCPHKYTVEEMDRETGELTEVEKQWLGFRAVTVFDISQTDGEDIPEGKDFCKVLDGEVEGYAELFKKLEEVSPVRVEFEDITDGSNGYFDPIAKRIAIKEGMSEAQTIKTTIHEIAHSMLHGANGSEKTADRYTKEVQAESVAYTVSSYLGLDTSEYSFGYITGWSKGKDAKELTASMETIRKTAESIIKAVA